MKTEGQARGMWFKEQREIALEYARGLRKMRTTVDKGMETYEYDNSPPMLARVELLIFFITLFYKLSLRLPQIEQYTPHLTEKTQMLIVWAEKQTRILCPELILMHYTQPNYK